MTHEESERQPLAPAAEPSASVGAADPTALRPLKQELKSTQQDLLNTIADLERSNERLKAANEEAGIRLGQRGHLPRTSSIPCTSL